MKKLVLLVFMTISFMNIEYEADKLGNIEGIEIPSYNVITEKDDISVVNSKIEAQLKTLIDSM